MQVLFHVDDSARLSGAVRNIENLLDEIPAATVELLVNGPAVQALVSQNDAVAHLAARPVRCARIHCTGLTLTPPNFLRP